MGLASGERRQLQGKSRSPCGCRRLAFSTVFPCRPAGSWCLRGIVARHDKVNILLCQQLQFILSSVLSLNPYNQPTNLDSSFPTTTISCLDHCSVPLIGLPALIVVPLPSHPHSMPEGNMVNAAITMSLPC